jgi:hypothetical protein
MAKFPVKFPVSREFLWRLVRSALRRQRGSEAVYGIGLGRTRPRAMLDGATLFRT